jgi:hypothetical protein
MAQENSQEGMEQGPKDLLSKERIEKEKYLGQLVRLELNTMRRLREEAEQK